MQQINFYIIAVQWKRETIYIMKFLFIFLTEQLNGIINQIIFKG